MSERMSDEQFLKLASDEEFERTFPEHPLSDPAAIQASRLWAALMSEEARCARDAEKRLQDEVGRLQSDLGAMVETEIENSGLHAEVARLRVEVESLRGIKPELPPRPSIAESLPGEMPPLKRYGLRWNSSTEPLAVPMLDGYWTPYHLAAEALAHERAHAERVVPTTVDCPNCGLLMGPHDHAPGCEYSR